MLKGTYLEEYFIHLRDILNWVLSVVRRELTEKICQRIKESILVGVCYRQTDATLQECNNV